MGVLAPIFFAAAGLRMDLTPPARRVPGARPGKPNHREGPALGAGLNARGVVEVTDDEREGEKLYAASSQPS